MVLNTTQFGQRVLKPGVQAGVYEGVQKQCNQVHGRMHAHAIRQSMVDRFDLLLENPETALDLG